MSDRLSEFRVAILATDLFQEDELIEPRKALEEAGATTVVIAPHAGEIKAAQKDKPAKSVKVDQTLADADPATFDAILLPGGRGNAEALRTEPLALDFVRYMSQMRRPVAFICHGGLVLIAAHLVKGRHLTSYNAVKDEFTSAGAFWYDKEVVLDGNFVSSRQPTDIPAFNREMLNLFIEYRLRSHAAA